MTGGIFNVIPFGEIVKWFWIALGLFLVFKGLKFLVIMHMMRTGVGYLNHYGGGDLRRDREPRFFFPRKLR